MVVVGVDGVVVDGLEADTEIDVGFPVPGHDVGVDDGVVVEVKVVPVNLEYLITGTKTDVIRYASRR